MMNGMRRLLVCLLACMLAWSMSGALAEVYVNGEVPADWYERELMRVTAFKLGACDGMLLEVGGQTMLIDGGTKNYDDEMTQGLKSRGLERVDYIFNTHPHGDHMACQYRLIRDWLLADEFITAFPETYNTEYQKRIIKIVKQQNIPIQQIGHGDTMTMGGAELTFLQAPEGDANAKSAMLHIRFGENGTILLTADVSGKAQHWYVANVPPELLDVVILKEPHHGLVQIVPDFLDIASPDFVFVNNMKNDTPKATSQLRFRNIPFLHTGSGTVTMETDGVDWYIFQEIGVF